jgi:sulfatase modifying factor 1
MVKPVVIAFALLFGCTGTPPAPSDSPRDPASGLPTRIVHPDSGIVLVLIPAGEFLMGSPPSEPGRSPQKERQHRRVIKRPFYLGQTEVTVAQFRKFVQATGYKTDAERGTPDGSGNPGPGGFAATPDGDRTWTATASWHNPFPNLKDYAVRDDHPVIHVSWNDAQAFCKHFNLRLPTEAQWEYAARAGSPHRFPWGDSDAAGQGHANVGDLANKGRFPRTNVHFPFDDGHALIAPVAQCKPNAWGLHDMIGNVEEWCQDAYRKYPEDGADESAADPDPAVAAGTVARILRGGAWIGNQGTSRSATRIGMRQSSRRDFQGFRVAMSVEP